MHRIIDIAKKNKKRNARKERKKEGRCIPLIFFPRFFLGVVAKSVLFHNNNSNNNNNGNVHYVQHFFKAPLWYITYYTHTSDMDAMAGEKN